MDTHLIAVDLDGTLLTDNKTISLRNRAALAKARELGHKVIIATGRPYRASGQYYHELFLDTPIVNFNGALVHHPKDRHFDVSHQPMDKKTAKTIIETCEAFRVKNMMVEVMDDFYLRHLNRGFAEAFTLGNTPADYGKLEKLLHHDPTSILVHPEEDHADELTTLLRSSHAEVTEQRNWGSPWNVIEITKGGVNKAVGVQKVASHLGIPRERIIAFGDEDNDLEMLDYVGTGVAMSNAIDQLKSVANEITYTNEEDGIARFLEERLRFSAVKEAR
ncbi:MULTISPECIES: Cof-type HAD-IIB family hydrolase [Alteribacter]|uniref:HAD family phosphatase n=1 Tax=Alteribacter keqinensis TaxID=2483800 RepID=A0A3M7TXR2_9BACI|nr:MULTISPECIES: Cof-type HAD-IIB family hydrolase [Alteribacter]MBM7097877.1 HAD family phosphatase [Alteribacter salitolerans]RNA70059.1 HAD family phosphatase [Alteribacter keqinensis]